MSISLDDLRDCLSTARKQLGGVGEASSYLWADGELWSGYSYTIPKEEQIRSALYKELSNRLIIETEWTLYEKGPRGQVRACGEIDLVGFGGNGKALRGPTLLLEIKRAWHLAGWVNKPRETAAAIKRDVIRLRDVKEMLAGVHAEPMAAVLIASFRDDGSSEPLLYVDEWETVLDWDHLYRWEADRGKSIDINVRFDLIRV